MARLESGGNLGQSRHAAPVSDAGKDGVACYQVGYKHPAILDVCAGQHGSVSQYYNI